MASTALFVSEQRFKAWTNVDANVRMQDISPYLIQSQDLYMQDTLGTKFYTRLKDGIINDNLTNDENNQVVTKLESLYRQYCVLVNSVSIITIPDHKPTGLLNKKSQNKNIIAIRITGKTSGFLKITTNVKHNRNSGAGIA